MTSLEAIGTEARFRVSLSYNNFEKIARRRVFSMRVAISTCV